jgi:hypothetical protein
MGRTITLTDLEILRWEVNLGQQYVQVYYRIVDQNGETYSFGDAIFWVTIPQINDPLQGQPNNWYQLPPSYIPILLQLTNDARTALLPLLQ